jgi:cytochrome c553
VNAARARSSSTHPGALRLRPAYDGRTRSSAGGRLHARTAVIAAILALHAGGSSLRTAGAISPATAQEARPAATDAHGAAVPPPLGDFCVGCHSPSGGPRLSGFLTGAWLAPNITPDPVSGIGAWARNDVFLYLRNGNAPGRGQAGGPMAQVVEALQQRTDGELLAIVDWLARQPAVRDPADRVAASARGARLDIDPALLRASVSMSAAADSAQRGALLYDGSCTTCHGADGAGTPDGKVPSLYHNSAVGRRTPYNLVAAMLQGVRRDTTGGQVLMPAFDAERHQPGSIPDGELAHLANFVLAKFGDPSAAVVKARDIESSRSAWWGPGEATAERGHLIAVGGGSGGAASACFRCHGLQGQGDAAAGFPRLAALDAGYLAKQMRDYASGNRANSVMAPIARQLDAADQQSIGLYYASLSFARPGVRLATPDPRLLQAGVALFAQGAAERGIPACANCHGSDARGFGAVYPGLAQPPSYVEAQLRSWRARIRHNDVGNFMGSLAQRLSDDDIRGVAAYLGLVP